MSSRSCECIQNISETKKNSIPVHCLESSCVLSTWRWNVLVLKNRNTRACRPQQSALESTSHMELHIRLRSPISCKQIRNQESPCVEIHTHRFKRMLINFLSYKSPDLQLSTVFPVPNIDHDCRWPDKLGLPLMIADGSHVGDLGSHRGYQIQKRVPLY